MDRRTWTKIVAAASIGSATGFRPRADRVVIVGGGVLGAAVAYKLAQRGADVTLCERDQLASGASSKSGAWLNAHHAKTPKSYFDLSYMSVLAWHDLDREIDDVLVKWGGRIEWARDDDAAREMVAGVEQQQRWGYPVEFLDPAQLTARVPDLLHDEALHLSIFSPAEGAVEPVTSVRALASAAEALGATIMTGTEVLDVQRSATGVMTVRTTAGVLEADTVVVAAGVDTPTLASWVGVDVPLRPAPGVLAHGTPTGPDLDPIVVGPDVFVIPQPSGRTVMGAGFVGEPVYSEAVPSSEIAEAERVLGLAKQRFRGMDAVELESVTLGWRPLPIDGHPVVGFPKSAPGVYLMVTHSGFSLAAILAQFAAIEILNGTEVDMLAPFRVERFQ